MGLRTGRPKGRPKGSKNKRTDLLSQEIASTAAALNGSIENAFEGDAHAYLMAIYKDPSKEISIRLDAAKAAAPYEKPKLASTELKGDADNPLQHKLIIEFKRPGE